MSKVTKTFTFDGKRYFVRADTESEAIEKMVRKKIELESGKRQISKNMTVSAWCDQWLKVYKLNAVSKSWYGQIERTCRNIICPEIGSMPLKSVRPIHLQCILNDKADYSASYVKKLHDIIRDIFRKAAKNNLLKTDPSEALIRPTGRKAVPRRSITPYERKMILKVCERHRAGTFIKVLLYSGLRPGEAAALQWCHVDFKRDEIRVEQALKRSGEIGDPKTNSGIRRVPLQSALREELLKNKKEPFDFVCTNADGKPLNETSIKRMWHSFVRELNIEMGCKVYRNSLIPPLPVADDLVMYCLRHTYCTDLQAAGVPINVARELMGHSDISVTAHIYTHSSEESLTAAREAMERLQESRRSAL